jgi:integrase
MNEVEAIKTAEDISTIESMLLKWGSQDYADIFKLGINVALRISDLLSITFAMVDLDKRELVLKEGKTGKSRTIRLNSTAIKIIQRRAFEAPNDTYVFEAKGTRNVGKIKPLDRSTVARKFQEIGSIVKINLGTHSMRKTRGYMMHKAGVSIEQICKVLNHSSPAVTMAYIGLTREETLATYDEFEL